MTMLRRHGLVIAVTILVAACAEPPAPETEAVTYNINAARISVSGLSSGAHLATQLHIAHSALFGGAAIVSGGPYYCAEGSLNQAIGPCIKGGDISVDNLVAHARDAEAAGKIDALANLQDDAVWIFHGVLDDIVSSDLTDATEVFYDQLTGSQEVISVSDIHAVHGLPTIATGPSCETFESPFLNACEYDAAGEILTTLHGDLNARVAASGQLRSIAQPGAEDASMLDEAFLYVPVACASGEACGVHVAIHGCTQSAAFVGDAFAAGAGFNEWAESNNLLVLYPQVGSSRIAPMNPYGCWDWWGYTNADYATKDGLQIQVIKSTLDRLAGITL